MSFNLFFSLIATLGFKKGEGAFIAIRETTEYQRIFRKTRKPSFKQNPRKTTISAIDSREVFHQLKHISSSFVDTRRTVELDWVRYMSSVWLFFLLFVPF